MHPSVRETEQDISCQNHRWWSPCGVRVMNCTCHVARTRDTTLGVYDNKLFFGLMFLVISTDEVSLRREGLPPATQLGHPWCQWQQGFSIGSICSIPKSKNICYKIGTNCPMIKPGVCRYRSASGLIMDFRTKNDKIEEAPNKTVKGQS